MGVPNPQTYRWPCISPLVLKTKQNHEVRERTGREETWGWQKWPIQCRQWTTVMRTEVCIENVKEHTSHLYNNFVKTLIILCDVFWSHSLIQPLASLSASQALSIEPHPHLPLSLFCVSPLLCEACPGGWSAYRARFTSFTKTYSILPAAPELLESCEWGLSIRELLCSSALVYLESRLLLKSPAASGS